MSEQQERKIRDLDVERADTNLSLLHQELAAAGLSICGVSRNGDKVRVHVYEDAPGGTDEQIRAIVAGHDPAGKSDLQRQDEADSALLSTLKGKKADQWKQDEKDKMFDLLIRRMG